MVEAALKVPAWNWALQFVGLVAAYAGAELNARMRVEGFYLWIVANITLGVLHALAGMWLLLLLDILFTRVNFVGIAHWRRRAALSSKGPTKGDGHG